MRYEILGEIDNRTATQIILSAKVTTHAKERRERIAYCLEGRPTVVAAKVIRREGYNKNELHIVLSNACTLVLSRSFEGYVLVTGMVSRVGQLKRLLGEKLDKTLEQIAYQNSQLGYNLI